MKGYLDDPNDLHDIMNLVKDADELVVTKPGLLTILRRLNETEARLASMRLVLKAHEPVVEVLRAMVAPVPLHSVTSDADVERMAIEAEVLTRRGEEALRGVEPSVCLAGNPTIGDIPCGDPECACAPTRA